MSTFSFMDLDEWAKRNQDILPKCDKCKGKRSVKCYACGGSGESKCDCCGHVGDCDKCDGTGGRRCMECGNKIAELYNAQLAADKLLLEKTRLIVSDKVVLDGAK